MAGGHASTGDERYRDAIIHPIKWPKKHLDANGGRPCGGH